MQAVDKVRTSMWLRSQLSIVCSIEHSQTTVVINKPQSTCSKAGLTWQVGRDYGDILLPQ